MKDMEKAPSINQSLGWQPHSAIESVLCKFSNPPMALHFWVLSSSHTENMPYQEA